MFNQNQTTEAAYKRAAYFLYKKHVILLRTTNIHQSKCNNMKKRLTYRQRSRIQDKAKIADDTENRKAHEAAETKRKKEWDARQLEKKLAEAEALKKLQNMSDDDVISASTKRIGTDVERITRRNMKECVAEHVQDLCRKDPAFARLTMHPRKSMAHCFRYINRKAKEFILQEMEENGIPKDSNGYGSDVPDGLCYQWSEDYFHDANAPEDTEKEENSYRNHIQEQQQNLKRQRPNLKRQRSQMKKAVKQRKQPAALNR